MAAHETTPSEGTVLVVAPGQSWDTELCRQIAGHGCLPVTISHSKQDLPARWVVRHHYESDVTQWGSYVDVLHRVTDEFRDLRAVVYGAVSRRAVSVASTANALLAELAVSAGALTTYQVTSRLLVRNSGRFIIAVGNHARRPDPQHFSQSMQATFSHGLAVLLSKVPDGPEVVEYVIEDQAAETTDQPAGQHGQLATELARLACGLDKPAP